MSVSKLFPLNPAPEGGGEEGIGLEVGVMFKVEEPMLFSEWHIYIPAGVTPTHFLLWERTDMEHGTVVRKQANAAAGAGGWKDIPAAKPFELLPGHTYIAAFYTALGQFGFTHGAYGAAIVSGPLYAFKDGEGDTGIGPARNGCFVFDNEREGPGAARGAAEGAVNIQCPKNSFGSTSYGADLGIEPVAVEEPETVYTDAMSGAIGIGGSGVDAAVRSDSAAGAIGLKGSSVATAAYGDERVGALTLGGSGVEASARTDSRAGALHLVGSGTAPPDVSAANYGGLVGGRTYVDDVGSEYLDAIGSSPRTGGYSG